MHLFDLVRARQHRTEPTHAHVAQPRSACARSSSGSSTRSSACPRSCRTSGSTSSPPTSSARRSTRRSSTTRSGPSTPPGSCSSTRRRKEFFARLGHHRQRRRRHPPRRRRPRPLRQAAHRPHRRALHPQRGVPRPLGRPPRQAPPHRHEALPPPRRRRAHPRLRIARPARRPRPAAHRLHRRTRLAVTRRGWTCSPAGRPRRQDDPAERSELMEIRTEAAHRQRVRPTGSPATSGSTASSQPDDRLDAERRRRPLPPRRPHRVAHPRRRPDPLRHRRRRPRPVARRADRHHPSRRRHPHAIRRVALARRRARALHDPPLLGSPAHLRRLRRPRSGPRGSVRRRTART